MSLQGLVYRNDITVFLSRSLLSKLGCNQGDKQGHLFSSVNAGTRCLMMMMMMMRTEMRLVSV